MNQAAVAHSAALGWPTEAYLQRGQGWVVRRHEIEYLRPALAGNDLIVRTWVYTIEKATSWRCYRIVNLREDKLVARSRTLWVWINYATGRPARIPAEVSASFTPVPDDVFAESS